VTLVSSYLTAHHYKDHFVLLWCYSKMIYKAADSKKTVGIWN